MFLISRGKLCPRNPARAYAQTPPLCPPLCEDMHSRVSCAFPVSGSQPHRGKIEKFRAFLGLRCLPAASPAYPYTLGVEWQDGDLSTSWTCTDDPQAGEVTNYACRAAFDLFSYRRVKQVKIGESSVPSRALAVGTREPRCSERRGRHTNAGCSKKHGVCWLLGLEALVISLSLKGGRCESFMYFRARLRIGIGSNSTLATHPLSDVSFILVPA